MGKCFYIISQMLIYFVDQIDQTQASSSLFTSDHFFSIEKVCTWHFHHIFSLPNRQHVLGGDYEVKQEEEKA